MSMLMVADSCLWNKMRLPITTDAQLKTWPETLNLSIFRGSNFSSATKLVRFSSRPLSHQAVCDIQAIMYHIHVSIVLHTFVCVKTIFYLALPIGSTHPSTQPYPAFIHFPDRVFPQTTTLLTQTRLFSDHHTDPSAILDPSWEKFRWYLFLFLEQALDDTIPSCLCRNIRCRVPYVVYIDKIHCLLSSLYMETNPWANAFVWWACFPLMSLMGWWTWCIEPCMGRRGLRVELMCWIVFWFALEEKVLEVLFSCLFTPAVDWTLALGKMCTLNAVILHAPLLTS